MRELSLPGRLLLLPGLAMTPEGFTNFRRAFGDEDIITPDWIPPEKKESLSHYAKRWAHTLNATLGDDGRPLFLAGVSMGGFIAQEMAPLLDPQPAAIFLIGSSTHGDGISKIFQSLGTFIGKFNAKNTKLITKYGATPQAFMNGLDDPGIRLTQKMASESDPDVLNWAYGASTEWVYAGPPDGYTMPPMFQVHGQKDPLMPIEKQNPDLVIEDGYHMINLSHDETIQRWLFDHALEVAGIDLSHTPRVEDPRVTVTRRVA